MLRWPNVVPTLPLAGLGAGTVGKPISGPDVNQTARPVGGSDRPAAFSIPHGTPMPDSAAGRRCWQSVREMKTDPHSRPDPAG
jgi:hypothetical protein